MHISTYGTKIIAIAFGNILRAHNFDSWKLEVQY